MTQMHIVNDTNASIGAVNDQALKDSGFSISWSRVQEVIENRVVKYPRVPFGAWFWHKFVKKKSIIQSVFLINDHIIGSDWPEADRRRQAFEHKCSGEQVGF